MANKFLDYSGLNYFWEKIKTLLSNKSDKGHSHSTSEVAGLADVAITGDYGSLSNTPCYMSPFNITWDGDTTDLIYATTTEVPDLGSVIYYRLSNVSPDPNIVEGSKVTMIAGDTPFKLSVMAENIINDDNGNYHLLFHAFNELVPLVFCISIPDTITIEANGASFTITFDDTGIYLVNSFGSYISEFYKKAKKLDAELLPDIAVDDEPIEGSLNLVKSGGVYTAIKNAASSAPSTGDGSINVDGFAKVATTGDFNDLINLPFYSSKINVPWNGNTDGKTEVSTSLISNINGELSYYNVSDKIVSVDEVKGGVFSVEGHGSVSSYDINEIGSEIFYGDGKDGGSFFVTSMDLGYSPFIFCVEKPETMTITTEGLGTFTITFSESGIYFLSSMGYVVTNFSTAGKKLSNEFISYDTTPTENSENLITSGGVYTAINEAIGTALGGSY